MIMRNLIALASLVVLLTPSATQAKDEDIRQQFVLCPVVRLVGRESQYACDVGQFNICHRIPQSYTGSRAAWMWNSYGGKGDFSITLYTGDTCNDKWARWSFNRKYGEHYTINDFQRKELWNNVRSFKIADFQTSTTTGSGQPKDNSFTVAKCSSQPEDG
ncbi:hypothetical protein BGZ95_004239, partial [Linnemannia exigua]